MAMIWDSRRPIRDGVARKNERKCRMIFLSRRLKGRLPQRGRARRNCRAGCENSNAAIAGSAGDSGFVAASGLATVEIFSRKFGAASDCRVIPARQLRLGKRANAAAERDATRRGAAGDHFAVIEFKNDSDLLYDSL
jgi:hypothetical protein